MYINVSGSCEGINRLVFDVVSLFVKHMPITLILIQYGY